MIVEIKSGEAHLNISVRGQSLTLSVTSSRLGGPFPWLWVIKTPAGETVEGNALSYTLAMKFAMEAAFRFKSRPPEHVKLAKRPTVKVKG